jgi:predicted enzyme related to lactoylglutathione lyase
MTGVSAVLFAKDLRKVSEFYRRVFAANVVNEDDTHAVLYVAGFHLTIHAIPAPLAAGIAISSPPARREQGAIRLDYPVINMTAARQLAASLGGGIDEVPPPWAHSMPNFFLGFDPEGNVFGITLAENR